MAKKLIQLLQLKKAFENQSGSMTFFVAILFTTMIGVAGIAIDIARFEARRTEIQANLDNCTLSAASLRKTISPRDVVIECMETAKMHANYTVVATNEVFSITHRKVKATGEISLDTYFMKLFGVDDLDLIVSSVAEERVPHVEVSLVLDISGSMHGERMNSLIPAAKEFVDTLLNANDENNPNRVSISLIPYNMQVNAGKTLFTEFYGEPDHHYSYCVEWSPSSIDTYGTDIDAFSELYFSHDFSYVLTNSNGDAVDEFGNIIPLDENGNPTKPLYVVDIDRTNQAVHMGYKNTTNYTYGGLDQPYCRDEEAGQILPFSSDATALKNQIDLLTARGNTSIDIGVKWGTVLLDPSSRNVISTLTTKWQTDDDTGSFSVDEFGGLVPADRQAVDPGFDGRPVDYDDDVTLKVLVVMTDGENTTEYRVKSNKRGTGNSGVWYNPSASTKTSAYSFSSQSGDNWTQLGWTDMWGRTPLHTYNYYKGGSWYNYWDYNIGNSVKNSNLSRICGKAREAGVVIFSIAYSATSNGKTALKDCAGNEAFYKEASTSSISDVFAEIGGVIEKLKLVQ